MLAQQRANAVRGFTVGLAARGAYSSSRLVDNLTYAGCSATKSAATTLQIGNPFFNVGFQVREHALNNAEFLNPTTRAEINRGNGCKILCERCFVLTHVAVIGFRVVLRIHTALTDRLRHKLPAGNRVIIALVVNAADKPRWHVVLYGTHFRTYFGNIHVGLATTTHNVCDDFIVNSFTLAAHVQIGLMLRKVTADFLGLFSPFLQHFFRHHYALHFAILQNVLLKTFVQTTLMRVNNVIVIVKKHFANMTVAQHACVGHNSLGCRLRTVVGEPQIVHHRKLLLGNAKVALDILFLLFVVVKKGFHVGAVWQLAHVFPRKQQIEGLFRHTHHLELLEEGLRFNGPLLRFV